MTFAAAVALSRVKALTHRRALTVSSIWAFLFAFSCLPTHDAKLIIVPALLLAAILFAFSPDRRTWRVEIQQGHDLQFVAFGLLWTLLSNVHLKSNYAQCVAQLSNMMLIGCLALLVRLVIIQRLGSKFLASLVAFTSAGILVSIAAHLWEGMSTHQRLNSFALNHSPIMAAGGYCCALFAILGLLRSKRFSAHAYALLAGAVAVLAIGLTWSQSRGPVISLCIALACIPIVDRFRQHSLVVVAACLTAYVIASATILFEQPLHMLICGQEISRLCAPSRRLELWSWAVASIAKFPLLGVGFGNYFPGDRPHPHNGLLSLAFFAGIPFLIAFMALAFDVARRLAAQPREPLVRYAVPALIFGFGFMGTDLSNAVGFINTQYLFLWIPIFVAYSAQSAKFAATSLPEIVGGPQENCSAEPKIRAQQVSTAVL